MDTEDVSSRFVDLDAWSATEVVEAMWEGQLSAVAVVRQALPAIAVAIEAAAEALGEAGRLVYVGAGTSGRVAIQDGAELPPTFDWPSERLVFLMAGGRDALTSSAEGAEDDAVEAGRLIAEAGIGARDVVIGVAASGATPFTVAATQEATRRGAVTIGIANNAGAPLLAAARHPILIETGHEVIAGSTRMQAGTAQKVVLNIISSEIMVRLGRVYGGMMVNMHATNAKLRHRAELMVARIAGCEPSTASRALDTSQGDIRVASLVVLGLDAESASASLARHGGSLRKALAELTGKATPVSLNTGDIVLDQANPTPLYLQLADAIRASINNGQVRVGDALPSERDLSQGARLSRVTVRKAIDMLLREGLLWRRHGSGTYVSRRIEQPAGLLAGFSADMTNRGAVPGSIWLERKIGAAAPEEAMTLALAIDANVTRLARVRTADGEPLAIERAVVPTALLPTIGEIGESLYRALGARGHRPVRGLQRLHASLATPQEAKLLSIPGGAAILRIERRTFLANGTPVEFTRSAYRGDRYDFVTEVRSPS